MIEGIDISGWQGAIDFFLVGRNEHVRYGPLLGRKSTGFIRFVYIKAQEGMGPTKSFARNWPLAGFEGLMRGPYLFFRTNSYGTGKQQGKRLYRTVGQLVPGDLPPLIDIEWHKGDKGYGVKRRIRAALSCLYEVEDQFNVAPLVYLPYAYWKYQLGGTSQFTRWGLFSVFGKVPPVWDEATFNQYSHKGRVPGIEAKRTDLDTFNGGLLALQHLAGIGTCEEGIA